MEKTIDERLFEALMRVPHRMRRLVLEAGFGVPEEPHHHPHPHHRPPHELDGHHRPGPPPAPPHGPGHKPFHAPEVAERRPAPSFERERVLGIIGNYEDGVRQKTLTEELKINPSSVSEMISRLEGDGYVKRTVDPADKRATLIRLTELGEARSAELSDERNERFKAVFEPLSHEEKEQLLILLDKLTAPRQEKEPENS